jgi:hypothetical protein
MTESMAATFLPIYNAQFGKLKTDDNSDVYQKITDIIAV